MMPSMQRRQRGVSLLEAVVALAVMAIGAVGIVGLQVSLRHNADMAKQRSEASRLAQETIEQARGFTSFSPVAGQVDWSMPANGAVTTHAGSNTTFTRTVTVVARGEADDDPRSKTLHVRVAWTDRKGDPQAVELNSIIAGIAPELAGSVLAPMRSTLLKRPGWRHPSIPLAAIDNGNGTSTFVPPSAPPGVQWIFSNETGLILKDVCPPAPASCVDKVPVYGFVRFATNPAGPTPADAEAPSSPVIPGVQVIVDQTAPYGPQTVACYHEAGSTAIAYFCAIPVNALAVQLAWSGQSRVDGLTLATNVADATASAHRVCRYTPARDCQPLVPSPPTEPGTWLFGAAGTTLSCTDPDPTAEPPTPKRRMSNADHPLNYVGVKEPLVGQNFLVIKAGSGTVPYACPADDSTTPLIQGNTWHHQPAS